MRYFKVNIRFTVSRDSGISGKILRYFKVNVRFTVSKATCCKVNVKRTVRKMSERYLVASR